MTDREKLYKSWMIPGSYFSEMLDCGSYYNQAVQMALKYLPQAVLEENKDKLVFITTAQRDGCRVARHYCENREVILFSERILPKLTDFTLRTHPISTKGPTLFQVVPFVF